jgi:hypothetical protein
MEGEVGFHIEVVLKIVICSDVGGPCSFFVLPVQLAT